MFDLPILQDKFGSSFGVYLPGTGFAAATIPFEKFHDREHAKQFIRRLVVPESFWSRYLYSLQGSLSAKTNVDLLDRIAFFLLNDKLRIVELGRLGKNHTAREGVVVDSIDSGGALVFYTTRAALFDRSEKTKSFPEIASAIAFISSLNLDEAQLSVIAESLDLKAPANSTISVEEIAASVMSGNLVIAEKQKQRLAPVPDEPEPSSENTPGARSVPLGDHVDNGSIVYKTWFQLTLLDEVGEAVNDVELKLAIDNRFEKLKTGADGKIRIDDVSDRFAIASIDDQEQLYDVLESRWEQAREGDIPGDNILDKLPYPRASAPLSLTHEIEHTVVFTPPLGQLFVELKDKTGRHLLTNRKYSISGPLPFEGLTDDLGIIHHEDVIPGDYILKVELECFQGTDDETLDVYETPLIVLDAGESKPQERLVGALPRVIKAGIGGMLFDKNKSFLLPTALKSLKKVRQVYAANNPADLLLVGHTDTTGEPDINDPLSVERAENTKAYLEDDVDAWLGMYDKSLSAHRVWGKREDKLMIRAMPDFRGSPSPVKWFQRTRQLTVDGKAGPKTREKLIEAYMSLDGVKLEDISELNISITTHGAGENFPVDRGGENVEEAPADNKEGLLDRRVEWFFFDKEFGVVPAPSSGDGEEYLQWRQSAEEHHDFIVDGIFHKTTVLEMHDTLFRTNSCVVLPEGETPDKDSEHDSITSIGLFATALRHNEEHPGLRAFIAGHTDSTASVSFNQKLSEERALCIAAVLEGNRDAFIELVKSRFKVADYKQIYSWCTRAFEDLVFTCEPEEIDNNEFTGIKTTKQFQQNYNDNKTALGAENQPDLKVDGAVGGKTWGAIFDIYEFALRQELGEDAACLGELRGKLFWVDDDRKALGFSEHHPVDKVGLDNVRSQANRRVELLFFTIGDEPDLVLAESDPDLSEIYLPIEYQHRAIEPMVSAKPWRADWQEPICNSTTPGKIRIFSDDLPVGSNVLISISNNFNGYVEALSVISSGNSFEIDFDDWDMFFYDSPKKTFGSDEEFPSVKYRFFVAVGGRKIASENEILYQESDQFDLGFKLDSLIESSPEQYGFTVCTLLGSKKFVTPEKAADDEGGATVKIEDVPPGGFLIAVDSPYSEDAFGGRQAT